MCCTNRRVIITAWRRAPECSTYHMPSHAKPVRRRPTRALHRQTHQQQQAATTTPASAPGANQPSNQEAAAVLTRVRVSGGGWVAELATTSAGGAPDKVVAPCCPRGARGRMAVFVRAFVSRVCECMCACGSACVTAWVCVNGVGVCGYFVHCGGRCWRSIISESRRPTLPLQGLPSTSTCAWSTMHHSRDASSPSSPRTSFVIRSGR